MLKVLVLVLSAATANAADFPHSINPSVFRMLERPNWAPRRTPELGPDEFLITPYVVQTVVPPKKGLICDYVVQKTLTLGALKISAGRSGGAYGVPYTPELFENSKTRTYLVSNIRPVETKGPKFQFVGQPEEKNTREQDVCLERSQKALQSMNAGTRAFLKSIFVEELHIRLVDNTADITLPMEHVSNLRLAPGDGLPRVQLTVYLRSEERGGCDAPTPEAVQTALTSWQSNPELLEALGKMQSRTADRIHDLQEKLKALTDEIQKLKTGK